MGIDDIRFEVKLTEQQERELRRIHEHIESAYGCKVACEVTSGSGMYVVAVRHATDGLSVQGNTVIGAVSAATMDAALDQLREWRDQGRFRSWDTFDDIRDPEKGRQSASGPTGNIFESSLGLKDLESSPWRLGPDGVTIEGSCRRCGQRMRVVYSWTEMGEVARAMLRHQADSDEPPGGWSRAHWNSYDDYFGMELKCTQFRSCAGVFDVVLGYNEVRRMMERAREKGWCPEESDDGEDDRC